MKLNLNEHINTTKNNKNGCMVKAQLAPEEWVLAFFYAGSDKNVRNPEINGMLMFTKQFFVFIKEIKKELDDVFEFFPYDYGPYSYVLQSVIDTLGKEGYIKEEIYENTKNFILTDKGVEKAKKICEKLDVKTIKTIEKLRREATQLGYSGVLRYVYSRYPEYTTASKIRGKVLYEY